MTNILLAGLLCIPVITFTGCELLKGNVSQETVDTWAADLRDFGELGTKAALLENANFRAPLQRARDSLVALEALPDGEVTVDDIISVVQHLPLDQMQSPKVQLYIMGGKIVLRHLNRSVDLGQVKNVKPFVTALREGMDAGLK